MTRHTNRLMRFVLTAIVVSGVSATSIAEAGQLFTDTGSLSTPRFSHSATRLASGKVLVAGGDVFSNTLATTEIYNPTTGAFEAGPTMATPRASHTATLLPDGRVLIVGGHTDGFVVTNTAELYDPFTGLTGTFTSVGPLSVPRFGHTATLLADGSGKVLIAGGLNAGFISEATAEVFDPAFMTFSGTGSMASARDSHAAVLLADGTVLVTGGYTTGDTTNAHSAERYDPANGGTFTDAGTMTVGRALHTATLLLNSGKVVLIGGSVIGDNGGAEVFEPTSRTTGTFTPTGSPLFPRLNHAATLLPSGLVFVVGRNDVASDTADLFDPVAGVFYGVMGMHEARSSTTATLLADGRVLVAAGLGDLSIPLNGAELFTPPNFSDPLKPEFAPAPIVDGGGNLGVTLDLFGHATPLLAGSAVSPTGLSLATDWLNDGFVVAAGNTYLPSYGLDNLGVTTYAFRAADTRGVFSFQVVTVTVQLPSGGSIGPQGTPGAPGAQGPAGPAGPAGSAGSSGAAGSQGPAGPQGAPGATGAAGAAGAQGPAGAPGPTGAQGPAGASGATGPQGPAGTAGPQGLKGDVGAQGPQGAPGLQGAPGSQGPKGETGAKGAKGDTGAQGPAGPVGSVPTGTMIFLMHGSLAPAGYTFVGTFCEEVKLAGQWYSSNVRFDIYRKN